MTAFAHLHLAETLGEGGMGVVYSAEHEILHRTVAVKMIREGSGSEATARFVREAELASRIQSANVVRVLYTALYGQTPYMVLERVEGRTLASDIDAHGPWSPPLVSTLIWQLVRGLEDIHAVDVVHADLKPENVMVDADPNGQFRARIIDFGVARSLRPGGAVFESDNSPAGTPCAMSPEQISEPAAPRRDWDIWALAGLAFTALTGKCAYDGETVANVLLAIVLGNAPLVSDAIAVSPLVDAVFCKAFARDVADRFATPAAFADALDAALREPAAHPHRVVTLPKPKPLRHLGLAHADTVAPRVRACAA